MSELLDDLAAEQLALELVVEPLDDAGWDAPTPAAGWRVRDQIGHLAFFDGQGALSATDPDAFVAETERDLADFEAFELRSGALGRELTGPSLLVAWRTARARCLQALAEAAPDARLPWYGPPMSVRSFTTARLMETWAHGQDVVDGLGLPIDARLATDRLAHICHIGASTRGWSYRVRGREVPEGDVRVELALPSGAPWVHGLEAAESSVRGGALDFCLVVTQRRNVADTALVATGALAEEWLTIAQCFAGAPTLPPAATGRRSA